MTTALVRARALLDTPPPQPVPGQLDLKEHLVSPKFPPGAAVAVHPGNGHMPESHWHGVVLLHHDNGVGGLLGLTDVQCTDPHRFLNQRVGHITTVETKTLRLTEAPESSEQTALFPAS
ncbi:hypothetical protein ABZ702_06590 [Streptomyces cyaneofuscatus]|uniref:hypothetical protein n=1 Tax=Streptomyces cyaneofuscatus TaxID=66883 RepID=UPI0033EED5D9